MPVTLLSVVLVMSAVVGGCSAVADELADVRCLEGALTEKAVNTCFRRSSAIYARNLNTLTRELEQALREEQFSGLSQLQVQWKVHTVKVCQWESAFFARMSVRRDVLGRCVADMTEARVRRLRIFLCEDAGKSGPCEAARRY